MFYHNNSFSVGWCFFKLLQDKVQGWVGSCCPAQSLSNTQFLLSVLILAWCQTALLVQQVLSSLQTERQPVDLEQYSVPVECIDPGTMPNCSPGSASSEFPTNRKTTWTYCISNSGFMSYWLTATPAFGFCYGHLSWTGNLNIVSSSWQKVQMFKSNVLGCKDPL